MNWEHNNTTKKQKSHQRPIYKYLKILSLVIIFISIGICIGTVLSIPENTENNTTINKMPTQYSAFINKEQEKPKEPFELDKSRSLRLILPAIRENESYDGKSSISAYIEVTIGPGNGSVLMTLNNILSRYDTQESIRTAYEVASFITNRSMDSVDITYNLIADASILQGPSAGAAFTIITVAAIEGKEINPTVRITGSINHDGSVGPAGKIKAKAIGSAQNNATTLFVPLGTSLEYIDKEYCNDYGIFKDYCQTDYIPAYIDESIEGLDVIEIRYVDEAFEYFFI